MRVKTVWDHGVNFAYKQLMKLSPKTVRKQIGSLLHSEPLNHWHLAVEWLGKMMKYEAQKALYVNEKKPQRIWILFLNNSAGFQGCSLHSAQGNDVFAVSHFTVQGIQFLKNKTKTLKIPKRKITPKQLNILVARESSSLETWQSAGDLQGWGILEEPGTSLPTFTFTLWNIECL